ncbi:MAG: 4-oxalomesaconate tautomerase [Rhodospirillaceae bacterium]
MTHTAIPYRLFRGGTSRGPYFLRDDLPKDQDTLAKVLVATIGSGHPLNIDGIGGGNAVTTKVAMLSRSEDPWADVDYFFAQVSVEDGLVDFKPTCGNILAGVGPAAIDMGLVPAKDGQTEVKIQAVNTKARVKAVINTPGGALDFDGSTAIDGVPGTSAAIQLTFLDVIGSTTGALLPSGNLRDDIDGVEVTCMDVAMPMVIARAADLGVTGYESVEELNDNKDFFARMEAVRLEAGKRMGMGDVTESVTPKFGILAPAREGGTLAVRYFMPWKTHPTMAVTGAQCVSSCALTPGTIADGLLERPTTSPATIQLEHPTGIIDVVVDYDSTNGFDLKAAGLVRTARKIADGRVYIPSTVWAGPEAEQ